MTELTDFKFKVLNDKLDELASDINRICSKLDTTYVRKAEFNFIRNIVLGTCSVILIAFLTYSANQLWPTKTIAIDPAGASQLHLK